MTIFIASLIQGIGAILQASSFSLPHFIVGRIVLGLGTGGIIATISLWQSELSKAETRGRHVSAFGLFCGSGLAIALFIAFGLSFTQPSSVSWRFVLAFTLLPSALSCAFIFTLPESPRWLGKQDRWDEAREILGLLYDEGPYSEPVDKEIQDIRLSLERTTKGDFTSMFRMGPQGEFHRVVLAATAQIFLQMSGVNSIEYYAPTIYEQQLHFNHVSSGVLAAASQLVMVLGAFCCAWSVDRFGRRRLMLISAASMSICFACLAGLTSHPNNQAGLKAAVFFLYIYFFAYSLGFLGIPFLYASEVAPAHLRAATCGLATTVSWLFNFLVAEVTPIAFTDIGWKYFIVYCCLNAAFVPIIYFFFPETAGRSLEEIDALFEASSSALDAVHMAKILPGRRNPEFIHEQKMAEATHVDEVGTPSE